MLLFFGDYGSMVRKWWIVAIWLIACNPFSDSLTNNTIEAAAANRECIQIALFSNIQTQAQDIWGYSSKQSIYSNCSVLKYSNSNTTYLRAQQLPENSMRCREGVISPNELDHFRSVVCLSASCRGEREWHLGVREREREWIIPFPKFGNGKGIEN